MKGWHHHRLITKTLNLTSRNLFLKKGASNVCDLKNLNPWALFDLVLINFILYPFIREIDAISKRHLHRQLPADILLGGNRLLRPFCLLLYQPPLNHTSTSPPLSTKPFLAWQRRDIGPHQIRISKTKKAPWKERKLSSRSLCRSLNPSSVSSWPNILLGQLLSVSLRPIQLTIRENHPP